MKTKITDFRNSIESEQAGFTIVELLIVIIVIGILAAITIVTFSGIQERARFASAASYAAQIKRSPDILDATAIYNFDDCTNGATSILDISEKNNTATVVGTASCSTDTPTGSGKSFSFDGLTHLTTPAQIGSSFYIKSVWVKMASCGTAQNFISTTTSNSGAVLYNCNNVQGGHNGSWITVSSGISIGDNKWHHLVMKYENGILTLIIDGKTVASGTVAAPSLLANQIGAYNGGNRYTGLMDDVIIIGR